MKELKTEIIVENNIYYQVSTYIKNNEKIIIWRNKDKNVHRINKPAILIYTCSNRLKSWLYFKNGLLHSYKKSKAAVYFRSKKFHLWNFKIWAKNGKIDRDKKPAILVTGRSSGNHIFPVMEGYFKNNTPCQNSKASLIFNDHDNTKHFESTLVILNDFDSYKNYNGYNLINFSKNRELVSKYRTVLSAKKDLELFFHQLYEHNQNIEDENVERTLLNFIRSFMDIRQNYSFIKTDCYYDLPHKVLFYLSNRKEYIWMNENGIHRGEKPAKIIFSDTRIEKLKYKENIPYEDIYSPFKTIFDKKNNLIDFEFFNKEVDKFYKEQNLTPHQLNEEEKELIELNFSY